MGSGLSVEVNGYLFRELECGCIYRCMYKNMIVERRVEMVKCCYHCLHRLKTDTFDMKPVYRVEDELFERSFEEIAYKSEWMTQVKALHYAKEKGIRTVEEFVYNTNILDKYR